MNQEIVIGPSLIDFLMESYREGDFKSKGSLFLQKLQDDSVCMDDERALDDFIEQKIYENGDDLILSLWTNFASVLNIKREKLENRHSNSIDLEAELATKAVDHLWLNDEVSDKKVDALQKKYGKKLIRQLSHKNYLDPSFKDSILYNGMSEILKKGDIFPIMKILEIALRNEKKVFIQDGYIQKDNAIANVIKVIERLNTNANVDVRTLTDKGRADTWGKKEIIKDREKQVLERFPNRNINFSYTGNKKTLHERFIETENFIINIGAGFDAYKSSQILKETSFSFNKK